ncbi:MAG: DUF7255 family protein [Cecembia sp.]
MHSLKISQLNDILTASEQPVDNDFLLEVNHGYLKGKGELLIQELFDQLGGKGKPPLLDKLKFDFKINRFLFLYDNEVHFNRFRLSTLKTNIYTTFSFPWVESYKRLCRNFERECLKSGSQERIWFGPPLAGRIFGKSEAIGDLSGNGAAGWKLNAYNDAQYDLLSRLHGYKLVRIPIYENLMIGGSLKKIDDLLLQPTEANRHAIIAWFSRKMV